MKPMAIAGIVFGVIFLGAVLGVVLRAALPEHHVGDSSKDVVRLVMGLIATMAALVLGLLIASAKSSYDTQSGELVHGAADVIQLDRLLAHYGPETVLARARFRDTVERAIDRIWPRDDGRSANLGLPADNNDAGDFYALISNLQPQTSAQRFAQSQALAIGAELSRTRVLMYEQAGSSIAWPFLVVLVFWLVILFVGFGLFAPANATVLAALFVGALSVSGAIFLILELDRPYDGMMHLSSAPLRNALAQIGP
ncbi:MAG: hypothetical protein ACLQJR_30230 [Stellaceae bacterium]